MDQSAGISWNSNRHWKREVTEKWDSGYQHTGYFLDYLEHRYGDGTVSRINEKLRTGHYGEKRFWTELLGRPVEQLWDDYTRSINTQATVDKAQIITEVLDYDDNEAVLVERQDAIDAPHSRSPPDPIQTLPERGSNVNKYQR